MQRAGRKQPGCGQGWNVDQQVKQGRKNLALTPMKTKIQKNKKKRQKGKIDTRTSLTQLEGTDR